LYSGLADKFIRPDMKRSPFLLSFYTKYLQMSLLYMVFSAGWQKGTEHMSQSGFLPSCCPSYPALFWNSTWKEWGMTGDPYLEKMMVKMTTFLINLLTGFW